EAQREGYQISKSTLIAADWVILVTSLAVEEFTTADVLALYRLRWRIELGFKRLKSLIGLQGPPGIDERSARPYVLAHLLMILLLEPLIHELEDPPRLAKAACPAPALGVCCASSLPPCSKRSFRSRPSHCYVDQNRHSGVTFMNHQDDGHIKACYR